MAGNKNSGRRKKIPVTDDIKVLKKMFLLYYAKLPILSLATEYVSRNRETVRRWREEDPTFRGELNRLRGEWIKSKVGKVKSPEWLLERIAREHFGADAPPTPVSLQLNVQLNGANTVQQLEKVEPLEQLTEVIREEEEPELTDNSGEDDYRLSPQTQPSENDEPRA